MYNYQLEQFKRSRYFYGKLLTVSDFQMEQDYFNKKRQMMNSFIAGTGVVWGLQVELTKTMGDTITLKRGLAIDGTGKEIVVPTNCDFSISDIFPKDTIFESTKNHYLCIEYNDNQQPVFTVMPNSEGCSSTSCYTCQEICERNKILESYKLYIKQVDSEKDILVSGPDITNILMDSRDIYDSEIKITRITPRWINPEEVFEVRLVFVKKRDVEVGDIEYKEILPKDFKVISGLDNDNKILVTSSDFVNGVFGKTYILKAGSQIEEEVEFESKVRLGTVEKKTVKANEIKIIAGSVVDEIVKHYFNPSTPSAYVPLQNAVVLAKLKLTRDTDGNLKFSAIEPINQYVYNNELLYRLISLTEKRIGSVDIMPFDDKPTINILNPDEPPKVSLEYVDNKLHFTFGFPKSSAMGSNVVSGKETISLLQDRPTKIKVFTSGDINPKLGRAPFNVQIGFENESGEVILGNSSDETSDFTYWTELSHDMESFCIKVKPGASCKLTTATFRWWAFSAIPVETKPEAAEIIVTPAKYTVPGKINKQFTVTMKDDPKDNRFSWEVYDYNNKYNLANDDKILESKGNTAIFKYSKPGTYRVIATSLQDPSKSAYAVVEIKPVEIKRFQLDVKEIEVVGAISHTYTATIESNLDDNSITWKFYEVIKGGGIKEIHTSIDPYMLVVDDNKATINYSKPGQYKLRAVLNTDNTIFAESDITITPVLASIYIKGNKFASGVGSVSNLVFEASLTTNSSNKAIKWEVVSENVSNTNNLLDITQNTTKAKFSYNIPGTYVIRASCMALPDVYDEVVVRIDPIETIVQIRTDKDIQIQVGKETLVTAAVKTNVANNEVDWTVVSGNEKDCTLDIRGNSVFFVSNKSGVYTLRATSQVDPSKYDDAKILVYMVRAISIEAIGNKYQLDGECADIRVNYDIEGIEYEDLTIEWEIGKVFANSYELEIRREYYNMARVTLKSNVRLTGECDLTVKVVKNGMVLASKTSRVTFHDIHKPIVQ